LTSNVVAAAVQEASLRGQIAATEEIIKIETQALGILHKQFELGQVAGADVAAVEATLAQAQATLPPLQQKLVVQRDLLTALIGRFPSQEPAEKLNLASLQLPQDLPVSLPSKLVEQRPDVGAAEAQLHAASAAIGVAVAAQLPQFTLTAMPAPLPTRSVNCLSHQAQRFGHWLATWRRRSSMPAPCYTRNAPPTPPSTRRRRCIAARSSPPSRTSPTRCMQFNPMPRL
jgi:outer membrane protein TolC